MREEWLRQVHVQRLAKIQYAVAVLFSLSSLRPCSSHLSRHCERTARLLLLSCQTMQTRMLREEQCELVVYEGPTWLTRNRSAVWGPPTAPARTVPRPATQRASVTQAGARNGVSGKAARSTSAAPSMVSAAQPRSSVAMKRSPSRVVPGGRAQAKRSLGIMRGGRQVRSVMGVSLSTFCLCMWGKTHE
jgi:hypothetical protein